MKRPILTLEETRNSIRALAEVIDKTATEIDDNERQSLVRAVLKTIVPTKGGPRKSTVARGTKVESRMNKTKRAQRRITRPSRRSRR